MDPAKAAYAVQDLEQALTALAMTNIRAVIGEMDLDQTLSSARAHQLLPAGDPGWRDRSLGHQGQPRRDSQGRAAGEPGARHEPADDRRARAPRHGDAGRGRPRRRHPAADKQALVLPAEGRQEAAMRDARRASGWPRPRPRPPAWWPRRPPAPASRRCATSSPKIREGLRGAGRQPVLEAGGGADGGLGAGRARHHPGRWNCCASIRAAATAAARPAGRQPGRSPVDTGLILGVLAGCCCWSPNAGAAGHLPASGRHRRVGTGLLPR